METIIGLIFSILVVSSSTVFSVLWLVGTFMAVSLILALLNLSFPALIYIIVYIGAIAILFLFVIQLLGTAPLYATVSKSSRSSNVTTLAFLFSVGMVSTGVVIANTLSTDIFSTELNLSTLFVVDTTTFSGLHTVTSGISTQVESFAEWAYGPGLLPLIIVSVVLLVAMIAPIYLCRTESAE